MELYIVRHGDAQPGEETSTLSDAGRALTPKGRKETQRVAQALRALGCRPGRIGTSPLKRALQTAEILAEALRVRDAPEECDFLAPDSDLEALVRWLHATGAKSAMVVGHMPDLAMLASALLTRKARLDITFKKSGVCCISFQGAPRAGAGCLEWLLQPGELRAFARRKKG